MPITALGFLAVFSVGCLVALKRPFVGLLLYFFVFYMHPPGKYWGAFLPEIRWTFIVAVVTLLSVIINEKNKKRWLQLGETKLLLIFFAYTCLQLFFVEFTEVQKTYVILLFKLILLFFLIVTLVNTQTRLYQLVIANCLGAAYIGFTALQTHSRGRFEAAGLPGIEDGNLLAIHLIPVIIMASVIILTDLKKKFLIFLPLAFAANLLFMSGSRGGLAGLFVAGLFFIWFSPKEKKQLVRRWAVVAALLGSALTGPLIIDRVNKVIKADEVEKVDKSAYSRVVIIKGQWEMFKDYPVMGYGHRGTLILSPIYISQEFMTKTAIGGRRASHNITMSFLVDHGILGSGIFFTLILTALAKVKLVRTAFSENQISSLVLLGATSGLFGLMAASQFSNSKVLEISIWTIAIIGSCSLLIRENKSVDGAQ